MPKIDKYRGKEKDELSKLTLSEALPLLTSRARRTMSRLAGIQHQMKLHREGN